MDSPKTSFPVFNAEGKILVDDFYYPQVYDASGEPLPLVPKHRNMLLLQLVTQGMKIQPCLLLFFNARDVILEADKCLTGGQNICKIWKGFSDRGLCEDWANTMGWRCAHRCGSFLAVSLAFDPDCCIMQGAKVARQLNHRAMCPCPVHIHTIALCPRL